MPPIVASNTGKSLTPGLACAVAGSARSSCGAESSSACCQSGRPVWLMPDQAGLSPTGTSTLSRTRKRVVRAELCGPASFFSPEPLQLQVSLRGSGAAVPPSSSPVSGQHVAGRSLSRALALWLTAQNQPQLRRRADTRLRWQRFCTARKTIHPTPCIPLFFS